MRRIEASHLAMLAALAACGDNHERGIDAPSLDASPDAPAMFGAPITISDPANASFVPAIAWRAGKVVVAWHDFPVGGSASRVVTTTIVDGVPGPITQIADTATGPKRPTLAVTTAGFVLAYEAVESSTSVIRTIDLDGDGNAIGSPVTVSAAGVSGSMPRVAARGDDVAFVWTDGAAHYFARRGPVETVAATNVGTTLQSGGLLNFPRIAIVGTQLMLAYRDGASTDDYEVYLLIRDVGGSFLGPLNVSRSAGLLSDDIALAVDGDGTLDIVWVDQSSVDVNAFEVSHATRSSAGLISAPALFGAQDQWSWTPSVVPGMTTVWHTGAGAGGELWLSSGAAPEHILPGEQGAMVALARGDTGELHLAYVTPQTPRQIRYARR